MKAFIVLADGYEPSEALADEIKGHVRERLSAYAYPRRVEFIPALPEPSVVSFDDVFETTPGPHQQRTYALIRQGRPA